MNSEIPRTALAVGLALLPVSAAQAQTPWPANLVNPKPAADDVVLPMPCGGSMVFRRVNIPSADALDDRRVQLGGTEPRFSYSENARSAYVGGGFVDPKAKNQRYYLIGKYEVTQLQFDALAASCPKATPEGQLPKTGATWAESAMFASRYADWLIKNAAAKLPVDEGVPGFVRLPTETEWEFAARGGVAVADTVFEQPAPPMPEGAKQYAWYAGTDSSNNELNAVGLLKPNPLGLHDMLGNAGEFVLDPFRLNKHARLHGQAGGYTVKGGDFRTALADLRSAARAEYLPVEKTGERRDKATGLRLVMVAPALPSAARLQTVQKLWAGLAQTPQAAGAAQPLADPVKEVEALAKATSDPALKTRIEGVGTVIKANIQARNEQRDRSARSELRVGAYLGRKIVEDGVRIALLEQQVKANLSEAITRNAKATLASSLDNRSATLDYMIDTLKQIGLDYPSATSTTQGELLKREFEARAVPGYGPLVDLAVKHSQAVRGGKPIDKTALLAELKSLEVRVLQR